MLKVCSVESTEELILNSVSEAHKAVKLKLSNPLQLSLLVQQCHRDDVNI